MELKKEIVDGLHVVRVSPAAEAPPVGRWRHIESSNVLAYFDGRGREWYCVDLDRCKDAGATLDWIAQVAKKGHWATPEVVGMLVIALDEHLDLQGTQCGGMGA